MAKRVPVNLADREKNGASPSPDVEQATPPKSPEPVIPQTPLEEDPEIGFFSSFRKDADDQLRKRRAEFARAMLRRFVPDDEPLLSKYNVLILYDKSSIIQQDADSIYAAIGKFKDQLPILLVINSQGGEIAPAYLIGKLCREHSKGKFAVVVPRLSKSAATLICCAADELHMGSLSELGPIDPQINRLPSLGLKDSIEHISELVAKFPASADMFANYLSRSLPLIHLGYYERVAQSAKQYAERLLATHVENKIADPAQIAQALVYAYKDHGFVIDKTEAKQIFGDSFVQVNTPEYELGNKIYEGISYIQKFCDYFSFRLSWIGSRASDCIFWEDKR